jgi:UDP:flavonoid glycosyltransferase YjiC (YdhE family)
MSRFGIFSFPGTGHLHPLTALGRELVGRGHEVVVFQVADVEPLVCALGLEFQPRSRPSLRSKGPRLPNGNSLPDRLELLFGDHAALKIGVLQRGEV